MSNWEERVLNNADLEAYHHRDWGRQSLVARRDNYHGAWGTVREGALGPGRAYSGHARRPLSSEGLWRIGATPRSTARPRVRLKTLRGAGEGCVANQWAAWRGAIGVPLQSSGRKSYTTPVPGPSPPNAPSPLGGR